jgi:signal transduction histidine kinase
VQRELDRLRVEIAQLRASRRRLVLAADAGRRSIERDLHDGVHQHLVALAVSLQLAGQTAKSDPGAVTALLEEMGRSVQEALREAAQLAQRIHPPTLEASDLGALLRSAATDAGVPAVVQVVAGSTCSPEHVMTIHVCWLEALARVGGEARLTIDVREHGDGLSFEIAGAALSDADLDPLRDRVEALGGELTVASSAAGRSCVSAALPVAP